MSASATSLAEQPRETADKLSFLLLFAAFLAMWKLKYVEINLPIVCEKFLLIS